MINPVTGGTQSEAEVRVHLGQLRIWAEAYNTLDQGSGGLYTVAKGISALEKALADSAPADGAVAASWAFLTKNQQVKWNSGGPTWEYYELVDDEWRITEYEVEVTLKNPRVRSQGHENY